MAKLNVLKKIISDVTTIADGKSFCYAKIKGWIAFIFGMTMCGYSTIHDHAAFNIKEVFEAVGLLLSAVGATIYMKKGDEPGGPIDTPQPLSGDK